MCNLPQLDALSPQALDLYHDATVKLIGAHAAEYIVYVFQRLNRVVNLHLPIARELQAFGKVQPSADNRATDRFAHQNRVENIQLERTRRQSDKRHGATLGKHA